MTTVSSIEWTEATWNPVTGCTKVSPGCKHCYAETMARRLRAMNVSGYESGFTNVRMMRNRLLEPILRKKPSVYFVNSMSDLFHPHVPDAYIDDVLDVIAQCKRHTFQVLTKRAERLPQFFGSRQAPSNLWLGVSVENQHYGKPRIPLLQSVSVTVRFLSCEPLISDLGTLDLTGIDWVIVGGESGHKARPMKPEWAHSIRRQAEAAGVPYFFKQWGKWGEDGVSRSKKANGRLLGGRLFDGMPPVDSAA